MTNKHIVIIGASSAIAEQCARLWAQHQPERFSLVGRDTQRLEPIAADLKARSGNTEISCITTDFYTPSTIQQTVDDICAQSPVDIVLIAHGNLPDQTQCQENLETANDVMQLNGLSPVLFAEAFAPHMQNNNHGTIAIIGSVAGDRGRKSNYTYGAAKGLVTRFAQGMQHRFSNTGVNVVLIKPGPTDTPMTAELKATGAKLAPVEQVAQNIVTGIDKGKAVIYTPFKWMIIMMVIRHLPPFVFNKLNI